MAGRYECSLSPEMLKRAVAELNEPEDNDARLAAIDRLRAKFQEEAECLELIRTDDAFLLRFLRVRKFDEKRAYETLVNYHRQRSEWREVFDIADDPKKVEYLLRAGCFMALRSERAKDDSFVLIGRPGLGFTSETTMTEFIALLVVSIEKLLEQEESQICGFTIIEDMTNFGVSYALQMASNGKKFLHIVQNCLPARVKSINMVNEALVFDIVYSIISQFMKDKMKERLALHGTNFATLHEKVDGRYLPFFLGGSGPDLNVDWWAGEILSDSSEGQDTAL